MWVVGYREGASHCTIKEISGDTVVGWLVHACLCVCVRVCVYVCVYVRVCVRLLPNMDRCGGWGVRKRHKLRVTEAS